MDSHISSPLHALALRLPLPLRFIVDGDATLRPDPAVQAMPAGTLLLPRPRRAALEVGLPAPVPSR